MRVCVCECRHVCVCECRRVCECLLHTCVCLLMCMFALRIVWGITFYINWLYLRTNLCSNFGLECNHLNQQWGEWGMAMPSLNLQWSGGSEAKPWKRWAVTVDRALRLILVGLCFLVRFANRCKHICVSHVYCNSVQWACLTVFAILHDDTLPITVPAVSQVEKKWWWCWWMWRGERRRWRPKPRWLDNIMNDLSEF